jgi:hypothetical protein
MIQTKGGTGVKENYDVIEKIVPMLTCPDKYQEIEKLLLMNSNLPGPRGNLTLAYKFAQCFEREQLDQNLSDLLFKWAGISSEKAPANTTEEYIPFCAILALGSHYVFTSEDKKIRIMNQIREAMNDKRWRMRESAAIGLQLIAEKDIGPVKSYITNWYGSSNLLEKRAFLAALAHPPILKEKETTRFSLRVSEAILEDLLKVSEDTWRTEEFATLSKGLQYCLSVFAAELPEEGFELLKKYARSKNKQVVKIIRANLGKTRLTKKYPGLVKEVLVELEQ